MHKSMQMVCTFRACHHCCPWQLESLKHAHTSFLPCRTSFDTAIQLPDSSPNPLQHPGTRRRYDVRAVVLRQTRLLPSRPAVWSAESDARDVAAAAGFMNVRV